MPEASRSGPERRGRKCCVLSGRKSYRLSPSQTKNAPAFRDYQLSHAGVERTGYGVCSTKRNPPPTSRKMNLKETTLPPENAPFLPRAPTYIAPSN